MIANTLGNPRDWASFSEEENTGYFLEFLTDRFWQDRNRARLFGITVNDGAYSIYVAPGGTVTGPEKTKSRFMTGDVVDLVSLKAANLIRQDVKRVKIISSGKIEKAVTVRGLGVTAGAKSAIEAAGGKVEA